MPKFNVRILDSAIRDLEKLDKSISRRIVKRIDWLSENLSLIRLETLTADMTGLYKTSCGKLLSYLSDSLGRRNHCDSRHRSS